jgi:hypothetical protein
VIDLALEESQASRCSYENRTLHLSQLTFNPQMSQSLLVKLSSAALDGENRVAQSQANYLIRPRTAATHSSRTCSLCSSIMYIAGLKIPLSSPQWLEVLVVLSTADYIRYTLTKVKELAVVSESKGGRIRPESIPPTFLGRIITPIHGLVIFIPPLVYVGALVLNRFQPPEWMARFAFATKMVDSTTSNALRVVACAASFALRSFTDATAKHLGDQWHTIGVGIGSSYRLTCLDPPPQIASREVQGCQDRPVCMGSSPRVQVSRSQILIV